MPDVRCPVCGMQNSADEEFCSFCNAKLKPVQLDPQSGALGADLPDWLQSLRSSEGSTSPVLPQEESLPDWLSGLPDQPTDLPVEEDIVKEDRAIGSSTEVVDEKGGTPDWMRDLISDIKFSDELRVEVPSNDDLRGEENQWLSRIDGNADESDSQSSEAPDSLSELENISPQVEPAVGSKLFSPETETLPEQPFFLEETELPDRLTGLVAESSEEVEQEVKMEVIEPAPILEKVEEGLFIEPVNSDQTNAEFSWLDELEATIPDFRPESVFPIIEDTPTSITQGEQGLGDLDTIPDDALPSWLSEGASGEEVIETPADEKESDSGLMPAELPSWLQAMRPIEPTSMAVEVATGVELEKVEVAGPLAGLRGVLPAEPDISQVQKPVSYSIKLQVTEIQQSQASLLEGMIHSEGETRPVPIRPVITSQHVLRIVIAVILFLSVLVPIATGIPQVSLPVDTPGISPSVQSIGSLSAGAPVLLAIDYAPGFSGEMDAITISVVDHLMRQGVYLAVVSTIPTGPVQAERLIASVNQEGNLAYGSPDRYINLGLIPGGPTGLLRFSGAPSQVLPRDILGKPAWNSQFLNGIEAISGFSMVIVATENPDTARSWIEQVQPGLNGVPLILVVSSQAEPILRPYYEAVPRQIHGLVGGLAGGVSYQTQIGKNGQASLYWPSFSLSMMFAGLLVAFGGMVNLALAYAARRKESDRNQR